MEFEIKITRCVNGYTVSPVSVVSQRDRFENLYVFENLFSLYQWLGEEFPKLETLNKEPKETE